MSKTSILGGITIITLVLIFILWSLINTTTFLPYEGAIRVPRMGNIILFTLITSQIIAGIASIVIILGYDLFWIILRKPIRSQDDMVKGVVLWTTILVQSIVMLHVLGIINIFVSLLSIAIIWGIVFYGGIKRKNRLKKYITKNSSGAKSKTDNDGQSKQSSS